MHWLQPVKEDGCHTNVWHWTETMVKNENMVLCVDNSDIRIREV